MRRGILLAAGALAAVAFTAWRVEAGDGMPTLDDRVTTLEAKVAVLEAKLARMSSAISSAPVPAADAEATRRAAEALRQIKLTVAITNVPLRDALRTIAEQTKTNMIVSPGVGNEPVSLKVENLALPEVLTMLATTGGFRWDVQPYGVVRITETNPR